MSTNWIYDTEFNYDDDSNDDPPAGSAKLAIEDKQFPLFISSEWRLIAKVNDYHVAITEPVDHPHSKEFIKKWSLMTIRTNQKQLKKLGVDVEKEYLMLGGRLSDL
jgi:hypothetical protein